MNPIPKISIVTPSFNQGRFIEETILSVIGQQYPNLEYIIIDGGSTDNSIEIIKKYEKYLSYWISEKDKGQSHGLNKGFLRASGDILAWLNSDDMYLPGTLNYISKIIQVNNPVLYFGNCIHFRQEGTEIISSGSDVQKAAKLKKLDIVDYIIQPSTFWTRNAWICAGTLREDLQYVFDWEWFIRAKKKGVKFHNVDKPLSLYRFHPGHKTSSGSYLRISEINKVYGMYNKEMSLLFKNLLTEDLYFETIPSKLLFYFLKKINKPRTIGDVLKILKKRKYTRYKPEIINDVEKMIGKR